MSNLDVGFREELEESNPYINQESQSENTDLGNVRQSESDETDDQENEDDEDEYDSEDTDDEIRSALEGVDFRPITNEVLSFGAQGTTGGSVMTAADERNNSQL